MQTTPQKHRRTRGLSLIELTLVLALMLALSSVVLYSISALTDWQRGRAAAESLKSVYLAQKSYLADHPSASYAAFEEEDLIPYLPNRPGSMPTALGLKEETLTLNFNVMPPRFQLSDSAYDPSDSPTDGLWDAGSL